MKRRAVIGGSALLAVVAVAVLAIALRGGPYGPKGPAADHARRACAEADRFHEIVDRDGSIADARNALARAVRAAERAVALDARWVPLQSGLETFEVALEHDDAGSANVAGRVVRAQCQVFRRPP